MVEPRHDSGVYGGNVCHGTTPTIGVPVSRPLFTGGAFVSVQITAVQFVCLDSGHSADRAILPQLGNDRDRGSMREVLSLASIYIKGAMPFVPVSSCIESVANWSNTPGS